MSARPTISRNCDHCGEPYQARVDSLKKGMGLYCGRPCAFEVRRSTRVKMTCLGCGVEFEVIPAKLKDDRGGKYCSDSCCRKHRYTTRPLAERFWEKVDVRGPDECWEWTAGRTPKGYGVIGSGDPGRGNMPATHAAWEIARGPVPDGLWVLHRCDNPPCCNVNHLFLGTNKDNTDDKVNKGRQLRGEASPLVKFSEKTICELRERHTKGESLPQLAEELGMHYQTAYKIVKGKRRTNPA